MATGLSCFFSEFGGGHLSQSGSAGDSHHRQELGPPVLEDAPLEQGQHIRHTEWNPLPQQGTTLWGPAARHRVG